MSEWWVADSQLDSAQKNVIGLPKEGSYLVVGPPGSGKTNLLLLRGSYLVKGDRPNVLVLMFTKQLRNFIVRGSSRYVVAKEKIQTIMKWGRDLLGEHGITVKDAGKDFDDIRKDVAMKLGGLFDKKPNLEHHLDCILVDEVQDCLPEEIDLFFRAAKQLFLVGDHRQEIYGATSAALTHLATKVADGAITRHELPFHYRNGEAICKVADVIAKQSGEDSLIGTCNYDETKDPSSAAFDECTDERDLVQRIVKNVRLQLKAYPNELIGIICPRNEDLTRVRALLQKSPIAANLVVGDDFDDPFAPERRVVICTMHNAKGMEFRAVHLPLLENVTKYRTQKRLAYTSVTRAKTSLTAYSLRPLPGYLEAAREATREKPKSNPKIADLFSGKK